MKLDLVPIARRVNDREQTIELLKKRTLTDASAAMGEILLQGQDLLKIKNQLAHGQWLPWLTKHCPKISERTAQNYMRLAGNPERAADVLNAGSIRKALAVIEEKPASTKEPRRWPPHQEATLKLSKLKTYVDRFPIDKWPGESLARFRELMQPLAAQLWPDKFK